MTRYLPRTIDCAWFLPGLLVILAGCSETVPTGSVAGTVSVNGKPVTAGTINFFMQAKGTAAEAKVDSAGKFKFSQELPVGSYKVYFQPPLPQPKSPDQEPETIDFPFEIQPKYQDLGQTPISKNVEAGPNEVKIDLE